MSYLEIIMSIISNSKTINEIMEELNIPKMKQIYVIHALKKGLLENKIIKIVDINEKLLWGGNHKYILNNQS